MSPDLARLAGLCGLILLAGLLSLNLGASGISPAGVLRALFAEAGERETLVVQTVRLPRLMAALMVGAALAGAGALLQLLTGNPLAEPGLLGINAGAALAVVLLVTLSPGTGRAALVPAGFTGALLAAGAVQLLGGSGRSASPLRLVLAGVVMASFLASLTAMLLIADAATLEAVRQWTVGSLYGQTPGTVRAVLPWLAPALILLILLRRPFGLLGLGDEAAAGLGLRVPLWRAGGIGLAALLAASAVALAGPVGFVGLIVPHAVRLAGTRGFAALVPLALAGGALAVALADLGPRALLGRDIPVGISLALGGAPVFLWLAMRRAGRG